ncbi:hypothetical protein [Variovorax sp. GT1P44]|uniref:hypothetical protein n=1 Tax=Variovorax sp. GT1P44 TaxID=3443742 RepID=UPI003F4576B2
MNVPVASAVTAGAIEVAEPADTLPGIEDEWPATQRMAYHPDLAPDALFNRAIPATAVAGAAEVLSRARRTLPPPLPASPSSSSLARSARRSAARRSSRSRSVASERQSLVSRLGTWGLVIAVVAAVALGWGYVYNARNSAVPAVAKEVALPVPAPAEPVTAPPVIAKMIEPAPVVTEAPPMEEPPPVPAKPASAPAKPRKAAAPVAVAPQPAATPVSEPAPPPPPEPVAPASPQSLCAGLNFIARAQCMAAQCAKADFRLHAQCEAVRRQQQIEEEKRNPTLIN